MFEGHQAGRLGRDHMMQRPFNQRDPGWAESSIATKDDAKVLRSGESLVSISENPSSNRKY